ncbi:hypothetical protein BD410DRAFT_829140 [Rickenella mellea]|uniref:Uncharacterized protein n=1 Tax=Rickenella mellea TaxID=50990 RepID=A0A4Y7Q2P5_9AGAM|nr:hypothetical protein BD410DRAFT_829140 [Rickenella mellea]
MPQTDQFAFFKHLNLVTERFKDDPETYEKCIKILEDGIPVASENNWSWCLMSNEAVIMDPIRALFKDQPDLIAPIQDYPTNQKPEERAWAAQKYLDTVKSELDGEPEVYEDFLTLMGDIGTGTIDDPTLTERVSLLFEGHPDLAKGFFEFKRQWDDLARGIVS